MIHATDGNFYGSTSTTLFKITSNGTFTTLYNFCLEQCSYTGVGAHTHATDGNFSGTTEIPGSNSSGGAAFSLSVGLAPNVETLPTSGAVGAAVQILGTNLTGATSVTFNGTVAAFTVVSSTLITTTVPSGASTGEVQVTTPSGTLLSNVAS